MGAQYPAEELAVTFLKHNIIAAFPVVCMSIIKQEDALHHILLVGDPATEDPIVQVKTVG
jgi:hypothetical protein